MLSTRCVLLYPPFLLPPPPSGFMYGNVYDEEERFERQAVFPKLLAKHATDFSWVRRVAGNCFVGYFHCFCRIRHRSTEMLSRQGLEEGWYSTNVPTNHSLPLSLGTQVPGGLPLPTDTLLHTNVPTNHSLPLSLGTQVPGGLPLPTDTLLHTNVPTHHSLPLSLGTQVPRGLPLPTDTLLHTNVPTLTTHSPSLWVHRYLGDCLSPQTHCYTLEVSFFGYLASHSSTDVTTPYTEEACIHSHFTCTSHA